MRTTWQVCLFVQSRWHRVRQEEQIKDVKHFLHTSLLREKVSKGEDSSLEGGKERENIFKNNWSRFDPQHIYLLLNVGRVKWSENRRLDFHKGFFLHRKTIFWSASRVQGCQAKHGCLRGQADQFWHGLSDPGTHASVSGRHRNLAFCTGFMTGLCFVWLESAVWKRSAPRGILCCRTIGDDLVACQPPE